MLLLRNVFVCLPYYFFGKPKIQTKTKKKKNTASLAKNDDDFLRLPEQLMFATRLSVVVLLFLFSLKWS